MALAAPWPAHSARDTYKRGGTMTRMPSGLSRPPTRTTSHNHHQVPSEISDQYPRSSSCLARTRSPSRNSRSRPSNTRTSTGPSSPSYPAAATRRGTRCSGTSTRTSSTRARQPASCPRRGSWAARRSARSQRRTSPTAGSSARSAASRSSGGTPTGTARRGSSMR
ncbi:hypothetical protein GSI_05213 [Ganoderma sinense ZZ0214-1]|uniref:Uncharacterized protein n=1 Tax=Ganoderma sinense ZZ0214-1 TaxID=1077348 RepID=A0A2G8SFG5_9APHY|nr:hypothetical protein GSI_05213 [Ganoderma sinense ZZ0214-1]